MQSTERAEKHGWVLQDVGVSAAALPRNEVQATVTRADPNASEHDVPEPDVTHGAEPDDAEEMELDHLDGKENAGDQNNNCASGRPLQALPPQSWR